MALPDGFEKQLVLAAEYGLLEKGNRPLRHCTSVNRDRT